MYPGRHTTPKSLIVKHVKFSLALKDCFSWMCQAIVFRKTLWIIAFFFALYAVVLFTLQIWKKKKMIVQVFRLFFYKIIKIISIAKIWGGQKWLDGR